jgi:CspA family cold shock protein
MGRGRDFRGGGGGRGRRVREEDEIEPPGATLRYPPDLAAHRTPSSHGAALDATVKWFSAEKGCGFVAIADGSGDAFLSIQVLQATGRDTISPGAKLNVVVGQGEKGRHVTKIVTIQDSGTATTPPSGTGSAVRPRSREADCATAKELLGKVKWFAIEKGMGFIAAEDGGKDVFVHISVVKQAQMAGLSEGQRIVMRVIETPKGRQAMSIVAAD